MLGVATPGLPDFGEKFRNGLSVDTDRRKRNEKIQFQISSGSVKLA